MKDSIGETKYFDQLGLAKLLITFVGDASGPIFSSEATHEDYNKTRSTDPSFPPQNQPALSRERERESRREHMNMPKV